MADTFQFVPHHRVAEFLANGWLVDDDLQDCHHGDHAVLMLAPADHPAADSEATE